MKDELQGQLVNILVDIQKAVSKASDFAVEQLPDVAMQYLMYGRVTKTVIIAISVLVLLCCAYTIYSRLKKLREQGYEDVDSEMLIFFSMIFSAVSGIVFLANISSFFMVWLAPKVWLIKQIAEIVR